MIDRRTAARAIDRATKRAVREGELLNGRLCLVVPGRKTYAYVRAGKAVVGLHRLALIARGELPEGSNALHACDNPPCFEHAHLTAGDQGENLRQMYERGGEVRRTSGSTHPNSKLSEDDVVRIFEDRSKGRTYASIAAEVGVTEERVRQIVNGEGWNHVAVGNPVDNERRAGAWETSSR